MADARHGMILTLALLSVLILAACCPYEPVEEETLKRTVLVYMVAENSLSYGDFHKADMEELDAAVNDIPSDCRLVVYVDDDNYPYLYHLQKDKHGNPVRRTLRQYEEDRESTSKEQLAEVMSLVTAMFPSDEYGFVYWSHGSAWMPATRSIGIDNGKNTYSNMGSKMEIAALAEVLEQFPRLEFLMFDACFMQAVEVDWALRNCARYIIASPAEIPGPGAPYDRIVAPMFAETCDVEGIIDEYYHCYYDSAYYVAEGSRYTFGALLSVVKTDELEALRVITKEMLDKYVSPDITEELILVQRYNPITASNRPEYYDMNGYMKHLITSTMDYVAWHAAFEKAVPYTRATGRWYSSYSNNMCILDRADYGGMSMFVPQKYSVFTDMLGWFKETSWYKDCWSSTGW
jgi:hypothetical protein